MKLERGQVDINRSFLWNLWHYRRTDQTREWSTVHDHMWRRIMAVHDLFFLGLIFLGVIVLSAATVMLKK